MTDQKKHTKRKPELYFVTHCFTMYNILFSDVYTGGRYCLISLGGGNRYEVTNLGFFASHVLEEDIFQILQKKILEIKLVICHTCIINYTTKFLNNNFAANSNNKIITCIK